MRDVLFVTEFFNKELRITDYEFSVFKAGHEAIITHSTRQ